MLTSTVFHR